MTGAHVDARLKRRAVADHRRRQARNGTPGWVVWCVEFTYPPTTDLAVAQEQHRLASTNGCRAQHSIRPVLIAEGGEHYRYADEQREEQA